MLTFTTSRHLTVLQRLALAFVLLVGLPSAALADKSAHTQQEFGALKQLPGSTPLKGSDPAVLDFRTRSSAGGIEARDGTLEGTACIVDGRTTVNTEAHCESTRYNGERGRLCCASVCTYVCQGKGSGRLSGSCEVSTSDCAFVPTRSGKGIDALEAQTPESPGR